MRSLLHPNFEKKFKKLPLKIQERFFERVALFEENYFHALLNNHSVDRAYPGCRSINITGDYRAIFHEKDNVPIFINIGTHPELYG